MTNYAERNLTIGAPGTADWIRREVFVNDREFSWAFWMLQHALLAMGYIELYEEDHGSDEALKAEVEALQKIVDEITPVAQKRSTHGEYEDALQFRQTAKRERKRALQRQQTINPNPS